MASSFSKLNSEIRKGGGAANADNSGDEDDDVGRLQTIGKRRHKDRDDDHLDEKRE